MPIRSRFEIEKQIEFEQREQLNASQSIARSLTNGVTRIGARDGATGRWQAITTQSDQTNGIKTYNTAPEQGELVRGIPIAGGMRSLDRQNIIPNPAPPERLNPVSWCRAWINEELEQQELSADGATGFVFVATQVFTVWFQVKGKEKIQLDRRVFQYGGGVPGDSQSGFYKLLGLHAIDANTQIIEVYSVNKRYAGFNLTTPAQTTTTVTRYLIRGGTNASVLSTYSAENLRLAGAELPPPPNLNIPYGEYFNADPFGVTSGDSQLEPQPAKYHGLYTKKFPKVGTYAIAPQGIARQLSTATETVKGNDSRRARLYTYLIKPAASQIGEYIRRSGGRELEFWQDVATQFGGEIPAPLGQFTRVGVNPDDIKSVAIGSPVNFLPVSEDISLINFADGGALSYLGTQKAEVILEAYEVKNYLPASFESSQSFKTIPSFAKLIGQTRISFNEPELMTQYFSEIGEVSKAPRIDFSRVNDILLKVIV